MRPTIVKHISKYGKWRLVSCTNRRHFWIKSFDDGCITVYAAYGEVIYSFADMIAGCFLSDSNFSKELLKTYKREKEVTKVKIIFNDVRYLLDVKEVTEHNVISRWLKVSQYKNGV